MTVTIKTNHQYRHTLDWNQLTPKEQKEFDSYITEENCWEYYFVRYRNWVYDLGEFSRIGGNNELNYWDGYIVDSFFSGVLIKYSRDFESVKMGTFYS